MSDALTKYRQGDGRKNALAKYQPGADLGALRKYLEAAAEGYWNRQGRLAREGLAMAEHGAQAVRGGDPMGAVGMFAGPAGYLASPITALLPTEQEVYNDPSLPQWFKPAAAGTVAAAGFLTPGPKVKGLGKGLGSLADDVTDAERAALQQRLAAEAGQTGGAPSTVGRDQALAKLTESTPSGITAYHGSPHTFDRFDMSKIGTGEGAQSFGHGLYFAENEGVAKSYRDTLGAGRGLTIDGQPFEPKNYAITQAVGALGDKPIELQEALTQYVARHKGNPYADTDDATKILSAIGRGTFKAGDAGRMYQVRLNVAPDELLDWDAPFSQQSDAVKGALKSAGLAPKETQFHALRDDGTWGPTKRGTPDPAGSDFALEKNAEASAKLKAAGIKGIRYKDAGSRGAEGGTYNFVIFDDSLVTILKRYGIPMTVGAGGVAMVNGEDMPPELASQIGG